MFRARNRPRLRLLPPLLPGGRLPCRLGCWEQPFPPLSVPSLPNFLPLPAPDPPQGQLNASSCLPAPPRPLCAGGSRGSAAQRSPGQRRAGLPGELCLTAVAETGSATQRGSLGASRGSPSWDWISFRFSFRSSPLAWGTQPCPGVLVLLTRRSWAAFTSCSRWFLSVALSPPRSIF